MEYIILQKLVGEVKLFLSRDEQIDKVVEFMKSIQTANSTEMLLTLKEAKELHIALDEKLKYTGAAFDTSIIPNSKICVRCGDSLGFIRRRIFLMDVCDKCEKMQYVMSGVSI